jgi:hypothetical protein
MYSLARAAVRLFPASLFSACSRLLCCTMIVRVRLPGTGTGYCSGHFALLNPLHTYLFCLLATMGTRWSSTSVASSEERSTIASSSSTITSRKRSRHEENDENDKENAQPQRKRRRISISILTHPLSLASDALHSLRGGMATMVARGFLSGVEFIAERTVKGITGEEEEVLIDALVEMVEYFQSVENVEILKRGWRAIYACSFLQTTRVAARDDISTIICVMDRHMDSLRLQLLGCRFLRTLMKTSADWNSLFEADGITVFLKALKKYPDDLVMQGLGITFLAMLIREVGDFPRLGRRSARAQVLAQGGLVILLDSIRRFKDDPRLLHTAVYGLHQLGFARAVKTQIIEIGGIQLLLQSIEDHMGDKCLVDLCLSALSKLSDEETIQGHDAFPLVLRSMRVYPSEQSIQCHCLVLLLRGVAIQTCASVLESAILLILMAMRNYEECASIQFFACAALREILQRTLARNDRTALRVISSTGGIECVLKAVETHRDIFGLQPVALLFLMHLWEERSPDQEPAVTAFGGGDHVIGLVSGLARF